MIERVRHSRTAPEMGADGRTRPAARFLDAGAKPKTRVMLFGVVAEKPKNEGFFIRRQAQTFRVG
jgi:hypothetical protein